jgi:tetratricopeptide (TPR) repeat protein
MDHLDYIDSYFNGYFSEEETRLFEERIQKDPSFAEEVAFYVSAFAVAKEEQAIASKKRFREISRQAPAPVRRINSGFKKFLPAIAMAAIFMGIAICWYLFFSPASPSILADQYIQKNLSRLSVKMGTNDSLQTGLTLYNKKKFPEAMQQFESILRTDTSNPAALLNAGFSALQMQEYDKALDLFKQLETQTDPLLSPALFYEALTLLRRNHIDDPAHAKQLLREIVRKDLNHKEDAMELLKKM